MMRLFVLLATLFLMFMLLFLFISFFLLFFVFFMFLALRMLLFMLVLLYFLFFPLRKCLWQGLIFIIMCWLATNCQIWKWLFILSLLRLFLQTLPLVACWWNASPIFGILIKISFRRITIRIVWCCDFRICYWSCLFWRAFTEFMSAFLEHFIKHTHGSETIKKDFCLVDSNQSNTFFLSQ